MQHLPWPCYLHCSLREVACIAALQLHQTPLKMAADTAAALTGARWFSRLSVAWQLLSMALSKPDLCEVVWQAVVCVLHVIKLPADAIGHQHALV